MPDVEQFVAAGSQVFGAISTTELEQIIQAGGEGFTGQEASLKAFLADLTTVANGYAQHTSDITQAVDGLNSLTASLAPTSGATATALTNLSQTVAILAKNSSQFETLLQSLDDLSSQGRSLLENYYPQIVTQLQTLQAVSSQLAQHQADLAGLLSEIPAARRRAARRRCGTATSSSTRTSSSAAFRAWVRTARPPSPARRMPPGRTPK